MILPRDISPTELDKRFRDAIALIQSAVSAFGDVEGPEDREARRNRAETDNLFFKQTYFPHYARQAEPEYRDEIQAALAARNAPQCVLGFRGSGKSTDISLIDAAHEILFGTARFFIFVSRSDQTATGEYTIPLKAELQFNPRIRCDFPELSVEGEQHDFVAGRTRVLARGLKQGMRGLKHGAWRPDRIRIEDVEDNNNRFSPELIKKMMRVIEGDLLESVGSGIDEQWSVIYVANYFSKRSLVHAVRTSKRWTTRVLRALRRVSEGEKNAHAIDGEVSTWPERYPTAMLIEKRRNAPETFATEWQQEPSDDENAFRAEWFHTYKESDLPPGCLRFGWIDPSPGEKETSDYKAYGVADFYRDDDGMKMYLLDCRIAHETVMQMVRNLYAMQVKWQPRMWGYEEVGAEFYLKKLIASHAAEFSATLTLRPVMKTFKAFPWKKDRIPQMMEPLETGRCFVPEGYGNHVARLIEQYVNYPDAANDDGPDMHSGLYKLGELYALRTPKITVL